MVSGKYSLVPTLVAGLAIRIIICTIFLFVSNKANDTLAYPWAIQQRSRIAAPLYYCGILFKHQTSYFIAGCKIKYSLEPMESLSNKYCTKTILLIQQKTYMFWFYVNCWSEAHCVFHAEFKNWHWSRYQWHCTKSFPLSQKRVFWVVSSHTVGPLCSRALLIFEPQYKYNILHYSLTLYLFSFPFSISCFPRYPWLEN